MPEHRALVVVNSVYQLLTAVHMRRSLLAGRPVELLLTDVTPGLAGYLPRLRQAAVFDRVIGGETAEINGKYGDGGARTTEGFKNREALFRFALDDALSQYTEIYFANFDIFTRMLACRYADDPCRFIWFEDGFSSYVIDYLREDRAAVNRHPEARKIREKVEAAYLYEPRLAMRGDGIANRPLPKIRREDRELLHLLNYIFDYQKPADSAKFLFLEQSFRAEGIRGNDIQLMEFCRQTVGSGQFMVKPHPRNTENLPMELGMTRRYRCDAPFELILLNGEPGEQALITVCSNAALTGRLVFGLDIPTVLLYELYDGKVLWKEDRLLRRYLKNYCRRFAGKNTYVPRTFYELRRILEYLGGVYG